ncbi:MAG: C-terminal binding protein [Bacillota bacterium]
MGNGGFKAVRLNARTFPVIPEELSELEKVGATLVCIEGATPGEILDEARDADAVLTVSAKLRKDVIDHLERCRVVSRYGIGVDYIDIDALTGKGIILTNVPDFCVHEMADHTMALILGITRQLVKMDEITRSGAWSNRLVYPTRRLAGKRLGFVAFGKIPRAVAERAKPFGLELWAYDPYVDPREAEKRSVDLVSSLEELLRGCDFVSVHTPLTEETRHLIGEAELRMMKPTAVLVNTSRGAVVDEDALVRALQERWIAGAALDVYEHIDVFVERDAKPVSPLTGLDNVVLTPHVGAISDESLQDLQVRAARQAAQVLSGRWPDNVVNKGVVPRYPLAGQPGGPR